MDGLYQIDSLQLSELFNKFFIVCKNDVQRDFVWDVDKCIMLLDDILNERGRFYGINTMGFSYVDEPMRKIECYDGQQRLTTYSLLIISLCFFIDENIPNTNEKKIKVLSMLKSLISRPDYRKFEENLAFIPNDGNSHNIDIFQNIFKLEKKSDFQKFVAQNDNKKNKYVKTINAFLERFCEIFEEIDEHYDNLNDSYKNIDRQDVCPDDKFLLSIVMSIINKPIIMMYIDSEEGKYNYFINQMKGENLIPSQFFETKLNELKTKTENQLIIEKFDEFLELFNHIKYVFDNNGNYDSNDTLLKYLIYYRTYKNHKVNNNLVDDIFYEYNQFSSISDIEFAINIAKIYNDILNLKKGKDIVYLNELDLYYEELCEKLCVINNVLKIRDTFNPIIIMLLIKYENNYGKICEYLDVLIKYGFLQFKLYKSSGNVDIRPIIEEIISKINKSDDINEFKLIINNEISSLYQETNTAYVEKINALKNLTIFSNSNFNKDLIKYILVEYYKSQEDDDSEELSLKKLSIEHVIPKKYDANYSHLTTQYTPEQIEELINSIGNQLLLVLKANQKISNKSIKEKVIYYKKSKFNENIDFATVIESCGELRPDLIINRHSKIIDFIGKYFEM